MKKLLPVLFIVILILVVAGCGGGSTNPVGPEQQSGTLKLQIAQNLNAKTIQPNIDMNIASYNIYGNGPGGATFRMDNVTDTTVSKHLAIGQWTINVDAFNRDNMNIAAGFTTITIIPERHQRLDYHRQESGTWRLSLGSVSNQRQYL